MLRVFAFILLALAGCATANGGLTVAAMETYFEETVFAAGDVRRWGGEIRLYVVDNTKSGADGRVSAEVRQVADLAGVPLVQATGLPDANFVVFVEEKTIGTLAVENATCITRGQFAAGTILEATVIVARGLDCVRHEAFHAVGFIRHVPKGARSMMTSDGLGAPMPADILAVRTLYDPRVRAGMTPAEARPVVRQILQEKLGG